MSKFMLSLVAFVMLFANIMLAAVNINTANESELSTLAGIGPSKAKAIIEYRKKQRFNTKEDIMKVKGIGQKLYDKIKNDIIVTTPPVKR